MTASARSAKTGSQVWTMPEYEKDVFVKNASRKELLRGQHH